MLTALLFVFVNCAGYLLAILRGPFWALLVYAHIYFNSPDPHINWWGELLPFQQWSYLTTAVLLASMFLHKNSLSDRPIRTVHLVIYFLGLTALLSLGSEFKPVSMGFLTLMVSYTVICFGLVKIMTERWQLRVLWLWLIILSAKLSLNAYLYGKRIHGRLENIGGADSVSSNLFGLLLVGVIPLMVPFLLSGKRYERIICLLCAPFILNALVLCNSRGAFVALAGGFFVAFIFLAERQLRKTMMAMAALGIVAFLYLADQEMMERLASLTQATQAINDDQQANTLSSGRLEIWGYGLQMVADHPFGAGPGGFKQLAKDYMPPEILKVHADGETGVRGAHSSYLLVLVEQGPLGLLLWLSICLGTWFNIHRGYRALRGREGADPFLILAVFSLGSSFVSTLLGGLFTSRVYYEFFWWQVAMAVVVAFFAREEVASLQEKQGERSGAAHP
ncbi:O-antigen ligase family protein [Geomonas subterranea]|uniref:O-antigen ligase family protein n=1 Tax=Geomonas subterranea TaxID=2847989 RepID=UPI001CD6EDE2|nr:O-antigen ligase family protein [Geomonas fuzhouensis]